MKSLLNKIEMLVKHLLEYVNTRIEILKIDAIEKVSAVVASLIAGAVLGCFLVLFILFASVALALLMMEWAGSAWAGFLIVAGIYLLLGLIVWGTRERVIKKKLRNRLTKEFFNKGNDNK